MPLSIFIKNMLVDQEITMMDLKWARLKSFELEINLRLEDLILLQMVV